MRSALNAALPRSKESSPQLGVIFCFSSLNKSIQWPVQSLDNCGSMLAHVSASETLGLSTGSTYVFKSDAFRPTQYMCRYRFRNDRWQYRVVLKLSRHALEVSYGKTMDCRLLKIFVSVLTASTQRITAVSVTAFDKTWYGQQSATTLPWLLRRKWKLIGVDDTLKPAPLRLRFLHATKHHIGILCLGSLLLLSNWVGHQELNLGIYTNMLTHFKKIHHPKGRTRKIVHFYQHQSSTYSLFCCHLGSQRGWRTLQQLECNNITCSCYSST